MKIKEEHRVSAIEIREKVEITKPTGLIKKIQSIARNQIFACVFMGTLAATAVTGCDNHSKQDSVLVCGTLQDFPVKGMFVEPKLNEDGTCTKFGFHYDNKLSDPVDLNFVVTHIKENGEIAKLPFVVQAMPGYHYVNIKFEESDGVKDAIVAEILNSDVNADEDCAPIAYYNLQNDKRSQYLTVPSSN